MRLRWLPAAVLLLLAGVTAAFAAAPGTSAPPCWAKHHVCPTTTSTTTSTTVPTTTGTTTTTTDSPPVPVGSLLFGDEFNGAAGSEPDSTKWGAKTGTAPSGTYRDGWNQISEDGAGDLSITAQLVGDVWYSGFISGKVGYSGPRYLEARAKVACGYGTWNSPVWEWGYPYGAAPSLEDDVIEQLGREPQTYHSTLHHWTAPGTGQASGKAIATGQTLCNGFHTYGAAVYPDRVDFYFDGSLMATDYASAIGLTDLTTWEEVTNVSLNMGGSWAGTPTITGPVSMLVDYVHVYQLSTAAAPTFASETAYTQNRPAFTPAREVDVATAPAFRTALTNLQAGDLVKATAPFTVTGETVIAKALASTAVLDLASVSFVYSGGSNLPAVYVKQAKHLQIYGGDLSTADTGGTCLLIHGSQQILWWGFKLHDCGGSGVGVFTALAAVDHLDLDGDVTKVGQNLAWDPHTDKGTGVHGAILWDAGTSNVFTNSRFAFDVHQITVGACVELGNPAVAVASGNTLIAECDGNPCRATTQTCGNGLELWGDTSTLSLDIKYLSVNDYAGAAIESALSPGQNVAGVTVEYGRGNNDLTNPYPVGLPLWDAHGEVYQDVAP